MEVEEDTVSLASMRDLKGIRKGILLNALNETKNLPEQVNRKSRDMILVTVKHLEENVSYSTVVDLDNIIDTAEVVNEQLSLTEKVQNQDETVLDSAVMKFSSTVIKECTDCLSKDINYYNPSEYAKLILEHVGGTGEIPEEGQRIPWESMETEICSLFKKTPFCSMLSGALEPLPKKPIEQKVRTHEKRASQSQVKKPEVIESTEKDAETEETSVSVIKIRKLVSDYCKQTQSSVDYFQLVLHPTNFGKTVENILHVAFLVRDGIFCLFIGENGNLQVMLRTKEMASQAKKSGNRKNIQNIVSLNFNQWQILTKHYNVQTPMITF